VKIFYLLFSSSGLSGINILYEVYNSQLLFCRKQSANIVFLSILSMLPILFIFFYYVIEIGYFFRFFRYEIFHLFLFLFGLYNIKNYQISYPQIRFIIICIIANGYFSLVPFLSGNEDYYLAQNEEGLIAYRTFYGYDFARMQPPISISPGGYGLCIALTIFSILKFEKNLRLKYLFISFIFPLYLSSFSISGLIFFIVTAFLELLTKKSKFLTYIFIIFFVVFFVFIFQSINLFAFESVFDYLLFIFFDKFNNVYEYLLYGGNFDLIGVPGFRTGIRDLAFLSIVSTYGLIPSLIYYSSLSYICFNLMKKNAIYILLFLTLFLHGGFYHYMSLLFFIHVYYLYLANYNNRQTVN